MHVNDYLQMGEDPGATVSVFLPNVIPSSVCILLVHLVARTHEYTHTHTHTHTHTSIHTNTHTHNEYVFIVQDSEKRNAVHAAAYCGDLQCLKAIISKGDPASLRPVERDMRVLSRSLCRVHAFTYTYPHCRVHVYVYTHIAEYMCMYIHTHSE